MGYFSNGDGARLGTVAYETGWKGDREETPVMITKAQARAIYLLDMYNHGYVEPSMKDLDWFIARVKPQIKGLVSAGFLRSNGFDGEYLLTTEARDAYSEWYQRVGFNLYEEIQGWLG